jgi:Ca2+-binding RTX toxin-like protein
MRLLPAVLAALTIPAGALAVLAVPAAAATPTCHGRTATIVGTGSGDFLTGTSGPDVIVGRGGDDAIKGLGGDDLVCAGPGADIVLGGPGDDRLHGGTDRPGGLGDFRYLDGDTLDGGPGDDLLAVDYDGRHPHNIPDAVSYEQAPRGVTVDLVAATATGWGNDTLVPTRDMGVLGSAHDDRVTGSSGSDRVVGNAGDDVIVTRGGDDTVYAETYAARPGDDTVITGAGDDSVVSLSGSDRIDTGTGNDEVEALSQAPGEVRTGSGDDFATLDLTVTDGLDTDGGAGSDILVLRGVDGLEGGQRPTLTVDLRDGTTLLDRGDAVDVAHGTDLGYEEHRFIGDLSWVFHGTDGPDRVLPLTGGPLQAWTYGGDDLIGGTEHDDHLDAGDGTDEVHGHGGVDTCTAYEAGEC